jgi:hypothetical protein
MSFGNFVFDIESLRHGIVTPQKSRDNLAPRFSPPNEEDRLDKKAADFFHAKVQSSRVARFFLVLDTKTGKNGPTRHKMYQRVIKFPKCP